MNPSNLAPLCQAPSSEVRSPLIQFPAGAVDCHAHVCGPATQFPYAQERIYTPPDATLENYQALLKMLGVDRSVLVQPSVYGTDNRAMLAALKSNPQQFRGVAVISNDPHKVKDQDFADLHAAGVRGLRCNIVDIADKSAGLPIEQLKNLAKRIQGFGWHLELLMHVNEYPDLAKTFEDFPVDLVFGHFGYTHAKYGVADKGFQGLLDLMKHQRAWVKMTGPYRICDGDLPYVDMRPFNDAVVEANSHRLIWGSDWPHVMVKKQMPHDADLCDLLGTWVQDDTLRNSILVSNPCILYDFPAPKS
ncbi:amidohydrolase family protein [Polynucleobacter sp. JS-Safj-400b-B2]|uniref:amidohydrolase family protein n=1 Tax=Polynucleobacter sp. JS-Safj-400b-B2 TaxID=2576921 RepID=UPI001C0D8763|nr:amidohydrolase family protein [Polynucleobacter sp. JS-Safj-400b-B2]MBU3625023.1 amidohydrolase family protein [Polynucleobacter sp. JS-Safj-400b-B2]